MITRLICIVIGYVFGLIQTGYFLGRANGIDIRDHGSGNSGATNTLRVLGTKAGLFVLLCDACKCILAVVCVHFLFGKAMPEYDYLYRMYAGLGVVIGHNFPFYLHFKGGKGIAATAGLIISMGPLYFVVHLTVFCLAFFTTHFVSLGSILVYITFFILTIICGQSGYFNSVEVIISQPVLTEMYIVIFVMTVMAILKHRKNITRLLNHEESKVYLSNKNK